MQLLDHLRELVSAVEPLSFTRPFLLRFRMIQIEALAFEPAFWKECRIGRVALPRASSLKADSLLLN